MIYAVSIVLQLIFVILKKDKGPISQFQIQAMVNHALMEKLVYVQSSTHQFLTWCLAFHKQIAKAALYAWIRTTVSS